MNKAADAFRTISEVASELEVPKHVLRFWEGKFPQIRPMKRGGGRRYYRPEDVALLKGIRRLLYDEGYTIKGVQKVLRDQGVDFVKGVDETLEASAAPRAQARSEHVNGSTAPFKLSRGHARQLRAIIGELEACRKLLSG